MIRQTVSLMLILVATGSLQILSPGARGQRTEPLASATQDPQVVQLLPPASSVIESNFSEILIGRYFTLAPYSSLDFEIGDVGGAQRVAFSLLAATPQIRHVRLQVFFGTPGAEVKTAIGTGDIRGSASPWLDLLTAIVDVHGSQCGVRIINDGSSSVVFRQFTAYFVRHPSN